MAVGLLFWVATRHWDHALKQLQSKYNELSRLEMTEREARASEHVARRREQLSRLQAEKALQVKRRFLNCVSHEMRTPLNAIAGFAEVLTTHCDELEPDEKADLSRRFQESTKLLVTGRGEKGMLTFSVSDTGPGIPKGRQKEVFELFPETGEEVKTTGMGLSICRSIVRLLGGMVYIDPHYEKGTRVIFSIKE